MTLTPSLLLNNISFIKRFLASYLGAGSVCDVTKSGQGGKIQTADGLRPEEEKGSVSNHQRAFDQPTSGILGK